MPASSEAGLGPTKFCPKCEVVQDISLFARNKRRVDGLQYWCKVCTKAYNADYYIRTPEKNPARVARTKKMRWAAKFYVRGVRQLSACTDCGLRDWVVMEFDHIADDKSANVSDLVKGGASLDTIRTEIAKCEMVCANCHRHRTRMRMLAAQRRP